MSDKTLLLLGNASFSQAKALFKQLLQLEIAGRMLFRG